MAYWNRSGGEEGGGKGGRGDQLINQPANQPESVGVIKCECGQLGGTHGADDDLRLLPCVQGHPATLAHLGEGGGQVRVWGLGMQGATARPPRSANPGSSGVLGWCTQSPA